ncbi:MAG TPA: hypothetical protein VI999_07585 [Thermoplasmata archaeon]|nr:hypothetical protein [Thermoplasmata archaeon]
MAAKGMVAVPRRAVARWRAAMALLGLGLGISVAGLGWDFIVHEILDEVQESIYAPPHLTIFAGIGVAGLGFLVALLGTRFRAAALPA